MGRSSSTGLPFLVARIDAGQYTYHREVPAALAPLVVGEVLLPWSGRTRVLAGKSTVKVSLGTGDEKTAHNRWAAVHPQIDALVQMAEVRTRDFNRPEPQADVPRLEPAHIRTVAGQAYHDVLATDDRGQVEQGYATPLAQLLLRIAQGAAPGGSHATMIAERAARRLEQRLHEGRIRDRHTWMLDKPIIEEELDDDATRLLATDLSEGDRLAPEQVEALAHGIRIDEIPSEVEQRLRENNLDLPPGHIDRRALALAITRAKLRALHDVGKRDRGAPIDTPARPPVVQPETAPVEPVPCLSQMLDRWIAMARPEDKQIGDARRYVRLFTTMHGDLSVDQITGRHVRTYRDALLECPRNAPSRLATASIAELSAWAKANPGKKPLGRNTINAKGVGTIATMLGQALQDDHIRSNPAEGQLLPTDDSDTQERRPFTAEELNRIFTTAIYQDDSRIPKGGGGWAGYWLPLLSLYTGARLEELGQALISDIRCKHGIDYLDITTLSENDDDDGSKALKTGSSRRRIPLHAMLIRLGFLDYVSAMKAKGATRLFPDLCEYRERYTKNFSRWFGRWLTKLELADPSLAFHSFRHSFTAELRRLKCNASIMKELLGHKQGDATSGYGRTNGYMHELGELNDEIQRIRFPGLCIDHLLAMRPWQKT